VSRAGGAWQLSNVGISSLTLADGDAEGFRYVPSSGIPAVPPSPAGVCAAAAPPVATAPPAVTAGPAVTTPAVNRAPPTSPSVAGVTPSVSVGPTVSAEPIPVGASSSPAAIVYGAAASAVPSGPARLPAPSPSPSGPEPGLLAAAIVGGGLLGLAILRLVAGRRAGP
jgi:hypothetical protein